MQRCSDSKARETVICPIGRVQALSRGMWRVALGGLVLLPVWLVWRRMSIGSLGASSRIVDYSAAFVVAVVAVGAAWSVLSGARWLALVIWAGTGIRVDALGLELRLGPFGRRSWTWAGLRVRYRSEMSIDVNDPETFEDMDPDVEARTRLPVIEEAASGRRINEVILAYGAWRESEMARRMGPVIREYRVRPADESDGS